MVEVGIEEIPRKISFKRRDKRGFEGFIVDLGGPGKRKQFSANSLTLAEKLRRAMAYLTASKEGPKSLEEAKRTNAQAEREMSARRRKLVLPEIEKALLTHGIETMPKYIHWNRQYSRFYYQKTGGIYKGFKADTPSESLKLALEFVNGSSR